MNITASECSSGCESGWTMYLDQSSYSADQFQKAGGKVVSEDCRHKAANVEEYNDDDKNEDLSMVSDASSGPPHYQEDEEDCSVETGYFCYGSSVSEQRNKRKNKKKIKEQRSKQQLSYSDDTASSPILRFAKNHIALSPSGGSTKHTFSATATPFKGKSALQKHFGFLKSSVSGKPASGKAGGLQGRKWE